MSSKSYLTVEKEVVTSFVISRSQFICYLCPISTYEEGISYLNFIRKKHSDATHNCYAIITIDNQNKFSDDGEPSGTAGSPISNVLTKKNLKNVIAIVTRYFGGIKLGAGGLVNSYTKAVADAVQEAKLVEMSSAYIYIIEAGYQDYNLLTNKLKDTNFVAVDTAFNENVTVSLAVKEEEEDIFVNFLSLATENRMHPLKKEIKFFNFRR